MINSKIPFSRFFLTSSHLNIASNIYRFFNHSLVDSRIFMNSFLFLSVSDINPEIVSIDKSMISFKTLLINFAAYFLNKLSPNSPFNNLL